MKYTLKICTLLFELNLKNLKSGAVEHNASLLSGTISGFSKICIHFLWLSCTQSLKIIQMKQSFLIPRYWYIEALFSFHFRNHSTTFLFSLPESTQDSQKPDFLIYSSAQRKKAGGKIINSCYIWYTIKSLNSWAHNTWLYQKYDLNHTPSQML